MRPVTQVPAHWSKDFVEHLRAVHFGLIAASAGLMLLVASSKPYNPAIAVREIQEIIELQRQWSPLWLVRLGASPETGVAKVLRQSHPIFRIPSTALQKVGTLHRTEDSKQNPMQYTFRFPEQDMYGRWSAKAFPKTLADFKNWWNALRRIHNVEIPWVFSSASELLDLFQKPTGGYVVLAGQGSSRVSQNDLDPIQLQIGERKGDDHELGYVGELLDEHDHHCYVFFPILEYFRVPLDQAILTKYFRNWHVDSFDKSFSDLAHTEHEFGELELEDIRKLLSDDAAKGTEVFEAFGMKFPADKFTFWGGLLLLSVQLYFFIYLRQLSGKLRADDPGWDVPWVGMDTSSLSQIILFISLVVLPVAAMALLGGQAFLVWRKTALQDGWWRRLLYRSEPFALGVALIATICLGFLSWRYRPKVEAEEPSYSSPLFY